MANWQRTLRVLWVVQFLTTMAMNLGLVFVPFYLADDPVLRVEDPSARAIYTGLILAGPFFTTILSTPIWGWVADRTGPKRQVVRACLGLGITQILMAVARSPDQMVAIRILQGMLSGVLAACLGLVAVVTPESQHGRAIAILQSATPAGQIFGPVFGGALAAHLGFRPTYALLGSVILSTALLSWLSLSQEGFEPIASANPIFALWKSTRAALANPVLRQALATLAGRQFAFTAAQGVFAIYAGNVITRWVADAGASSAWWNSRIGFTAVAMMTTGLASVFSSPWWGRLHDREVPFLVSAGLIILSASMMAHFAIPRWSTILLARAGVGIGIASLATLQFAVIVKQGRSDQRGQLMGVATAFTHIGNLAGFVSGGVIASRWSESCNFGLAAGVFLLLGIAALRRDLFSRKNSARLTMKSRVSACILK
jgi:DHA1 family multidrug resistance protein-like MFS transporter